MKKIYLAVVVLLCVHFSNAQITARIIESDTGEPIPYANIAIGSENQISNFEGYFTVPQSQDDAVLKISFFGFAPVQITVDQLRQRNLIVKMQPVVMNWMRLRSPKDQHRPQLWLKSRKT